jgi:hypothetical protein
MASVRWVVAWKHLSAIDTRRGFPPSGPTSPPAKPDATDTGRVEPSTADARLTPGHGAMLRRCRASGFHGAGVRNYFAMEAATLSLCRSA